MSVYDTPDGRKALEKVDYCFAEVYRAEAVLAMIEWLAEQERGMALVIGRCEWDGAMGQYVKADWWHVDMDTGHDIRTVGAPTLDEALVAAVLASKEKTPLTEDDEQATPTNAPGPTGQAVPMRIVPHPPRQTGDDARTDASGTPDRS